MTTTDEFNRLKCEQIVNESWSKARGFYEDLKEILEKEGPEDERDEAILMIAANAAYQKMTLDNADDEMLFG